MGVQVCPTLDLNPLRESKCFRFANLRERLYCSTFKFGVQGLKGSSWLKHLECNVNVFYRYNTVILRFKFSDSLNVRKFSRLFCKKGVQIKGSILNPLVSTSNNIKKEVQD